MNKAVHKFIDFADGIVEEAAMNQAQVGLLDDNHDAVEKYEYISSKAKLISHDIKNHLSIIDLYSKIAERRLQQSDSDELKESLLNAVASIKKSKDAIYSLVSQIRTIQSAQLETLKFSELLNNAISLVKAKADDSAVNIEISNIYDGEILADEQKLLNVLINLFYKNLHGNPTFLLQIILHINILHLEDNLFVLLVLNYL